MGKTDRVEPSSGRVLSAAFLEKHTSKNDLIRRLRLVSTTLNDPDVEPNSPDFPGLGGLSAVLVEDRFLEHRDKEVRLHTVLACMQILEVYAPEAPYDDTEVLRIFSQLIRQLANLAHCTSPSQANYQYYHRLVELLSDVKIGTILVDLTKTLDNDSEPSRDEAMEMLADLIRTILQCVNVDHPSDVHEHAVTAVSVCLEEFDNNLPIPIMDEILISISAGPVVMVTNPAAVEAAARLAAAKKKGGKMDEKMPPLQIQQTNPSYMVAAAIIKRCVDRVSTPIANFLNGLLNGDPATLEQTNISADDNVPATDGHFSAPEKQPNANVWTIIYELHKISPQILTTVIGTVTNSLQSPNLERRLRVTKLLGRLFSAPTSKIGVQFGPCYREWIRRSTDISDKVRLAMVKHLVNILANKGHEEALAKDASDALVKMMEHDPNLDVRLEAIRQVCDLAYHEKDKKSNAAVPARLLLAVGNRVSSKNKTERRDALTGLSQIYYSHYVVTKLKQVQSGGDDCEIEVILDALRDTYELQGGSAKKRRLADDDGLDSFDLDEKYKWIPSLVFKSACFNDANDPEMRNRVVQIVDDLLLGGMKNSLTPTSQAVGLAFIIASLRDDDEDPRGPITSNAYKWMCTLFSQRASLQRAVANYLDARAKIKASKQGTEEALAAEAEAIERLEIVATLTAPVPGSSDIRPVLEKLHTARDKHIFRILATISNSNHSASARIRAFDELPKRTKSLGDSTSVWVKMLARRCAMGNFLNVEIIKHCILLAQECFRGGHIPECAEFLTCVRTAVEIFPALCGTKDGFGTLIELFGECRAGSSSKIKKLIEEYGMVTTLSSILAAAAPAMTGSGSDKEKSMGAIDSELQAQLLNLCTRDGTPEQARDAVYTMAALLNPSKDATPGSKEHEILTWDEQHHTFGSLLKSLTSPSRMRLGTGNFKIISILTALAALAECAPALFCKDGHSVGKGGDKAIKFALEACLLGRGPSTDEEESEASDEEMSVGECAEDKTPNSAKSKSRQSRKSGASSKHMTPDGTKSAVEDETLSLACRRVCAAIEFLVSYIRHAGKSDSKIHVTSKAPAERVEQVFGILCQIIEDGGLPPATRDRRDCGARQDRAALRKCAAIHLLRLCDSRTRLEATYLTYARWHVLAGSLLDEEKSVRDGIMEELSMMLTGKGAYRPSGSTFAPGLRFLAMVTLCTDMDHGAAHSGANGNAANVGKRSVTMKTAAMHCIIGLRKTCDATLAQCRALGAVAEHNFETRTKMMIMPEYVVPFALHLLSFRRETPSAGGGTGSGLTQPSSTQSGEDEPLTIDEENRHKMLRKRLKWLFEPLVQSLGEGADNISFLLRMVDFLGNQYQPKDVITISQDVASPISPNSILSPAENVDQRAEAALRSAALSAAKLKVICVASREVLLSFVKKDINLTPYPGGIQLPSSLFRRAQGSEKPSLSQQSGGTSARSLQDSSISSPRTVERKRKAATDGGVKTSGRKNKESHRGLSPASSNSANRDSLDSGESMGYTDSPRRKSRVHFSPELEQRRSIRSSQGSDGAGDISFGGLSPIVKPHSPSREDRSVVSEVKTLGTTPPSILRTAPEDDASTDVELRLSLDSSKSASSSGSRRSTRRSAQSITETPEIIQQSAETMTTSETPLSDVQDDYSESHSSAEKRKPKRREESTHRRKKSKKESLPPAAKIKLNRTDAAEAKKKSKNSRCATKISSMGDEFSFSDDENVENSRKVSKKPISSQIVKKKPVAKGRIAVTKTRTGRTRVS